MWIIVKFPTDNTVAVVPKAWLEDGLCPWDSGRMCQKLIKQLDPPNPEFEKFPATQVGTFETDYYSVAVQKLRQAEETSSLSSADESSLPPRKRIPNRSHNDFVLGDLSRISEAPPILDMEIANFLAENNDILDLDAAAAETLNNTGIPENNVTERVSHNMANTGLNVNTNAIGEQLTSNTECCQCKTISQEIQTLKVVIEANQKWNTNTYAHILKQTQDSVGLMSLNNPSTEEVEWKFPIQSLEDMDRFEEDLKTPEFKQNMLKHLRRIGGNFPEDCTRRLWKYLLTVEMQYKCNWTGLKNKRPLKDTLLNELIQSAVQQYFGTATLKTIQTTTKDYIQHSSNRLKK